MPQIARLEAENFDWGHATVSSIADWAKKVEAALQNYYVDSIEIDLGFAFGITAKGSSTLKYKSPPTK